jgi:hypothetical protein
MISRPVALLASLACISTVHAQVGGPGLEYTRFSAGYSGGMDLDDSEGDLEVYHADMRTRLSDPITAFDHLTITPALHYRATRLNFSDTGADFPIGDEDLHSIALSASLTYNETGSPWIYNGWTRAKMASDFQDIDADDFTFDVLAGVGYRFSESFTLGFGIVALDLNGDESIFPGINFDWKATETLRVGLYGLNFVTAYTPTEDWIFSFVIDSASEQWNIRADNGRSRNIDFTSYRAGLFVDRRLTEQVWVRAGAGMTAGNEIELESPNGDRDYKSDLDEGIFGEISLRVLSW